MKKRAPRSTPHCLVELTKVDYARLRDNLIVLEGLHATEKEHRAALKASWNKYNVVHRAERVPRNTE